MSQPAFQVSLKKARARGERVGVANLVTLTGTYLPGGVTVTEPQLNRVDFVIGSLNSGYGAGSGVVFDMGWFAGQLNNTFKLALGTNQSGAAITSSGLVPQIGVVELVSGANISGTQISYIAMGE